jgi:hypothetical protein
MADRAISAISSNAPARAVITMKGHYTGIPRVGMAVVRLFLGITRLKQVGSVLAAQPAEDKRPFGASTLSLSFIEDTPLRQHADPLDEHEDGAA